MSHKIIKQKDKVKASKTAVALRFVLRVLKASKGMTRGEIMGLCERSANKGYIGSINWAIYALRLNGLITKTRGHAGLYSMTKKGQAALAA